MVRLVILVVGALGVFSFLAFQQGGYVPGTVLALAAVAMLALGVMSGARRVSNAGTAVPWSPTAKKVIAGVSLVLVIGVVYSGYWMFRMPKASSDKLSTTYDLRDLCDTPARYFPEAAAYTGSAPHPIVVFARDALDLHPVSLDSSAPAQWRPTSPRDVQLVACLGDVESGPSVTTCTFTKGTVPMYQGKYSGSVFETRTGKKVGSLSVDGVTHQKCPYAVLTDADHPKIHSVPDLAALQAVLGDKVDR